MCNELRNNINLITAPSYTTKEYSKMIHVLKTIFWEEVKSRAPFLGSIEILKKEKLEQAEEKRLNELLNIMNDKFIDLEKNRIDKDYINTEEFARILFTTFDKARVDYREEKLKHYANILLNYSTYEFSNDFYKEGIIESLSKFSIEHILVLDTIYNKHLEVNDEKKPDFDGTDNLCKDIMSKDIWNICVNTLKSDGFIAQGFFGGYFITKYGIKCVKLIKSY